MTDPRVAVILAQVDYQHCDHKLNNAQLEYVEADCNDKDCLPDWRENLEILAVEMLQVRAAYFDACKTANVCPAIDCLNKSSIRYVGGQCVQHWTDH